MKCSMKTMINAGLALGVAVAVGYAVLPALREWILVLSPFLFLLVCPLAMILMMKAMSSHDSGSAALPSVDKAPASTDASPEDRPARTTVHG